MKKLLLSSGLFFLICVSLYSRETLIGPPDTSSNTSNCAFNVSQFALSVFHRSLAFGEEDKIFGRNKEKLCSLADIKDALESAGLFVSGIKVDNSEEFTSLFEPGRLFIVHLNGHEQDHFVDFYITASNRILFGNYPTMQVVKDTEKVKIFFTKYASGRLLVIQTHPIDAKFISHSLSSTSSSTPLNASAGSRPRALSEPNKRPLDIPSKVLVAMANPKTLKAQIKVQNNSDSAIEITKIKGGCSCVIGISPQNATLQAKESAIFSVDISLDKYDFIHGTIVVFEFHPVGTDKSLLETTALVSSSNVPDKKPIMISKAVWNLGVINHVPEAMQATVYIPSNLDAKRIRKNSSVSSEGGIAGRLSNWREYVIDNTRYVAADLDFSLDPGLKNGAIYNEISVHWNDEIAKIYVQGYMCTK